jgi:hypothetical protein
LSSLVVAADVAHQHWFKFEQDKLHLLASGLSVFSDSVPVS